MVSGVIGTAALGFAAAGVAFPPALLATGAVIGLGAAAWTVGNLVADHGGAAVDWVSERAADAGEAVGGFFEGAADVAGTSPTSSPSGIS